MKKIFTIGHSNHDFDKFAALLKKHRITALVDVRSAPYSKFHVQFNRESVKAKLPQYGIKYIFLGKELGARSRDPDCYEGNTVKYARLAQTGLFQEGIERLKKGAEKHRICLMCVERDPLECHRMILVTRNLKNFGVFHILYNGELESDEETIARLREGLNLDMPSLFDSEKDLEEEAFNRQEAKIAYSEI